MRLWLTVQADRSRWAVGDGVESTARFRRADHLLEVLRDLGQAIGKFLTTGDLAVNQWDGPAHQ